MKYQVPQFIEIEDKIFGPLTLKQFLYVAGGSSIAFIIWSILPKFIAVLLIIPILIFFIALAFYEHNQRPFIVTVESAIKYFLSSKLYIWKKIPRKPEAEVSSEKISPVMDIPKMSNSKLSELAWSLDINKNLSEVESNSENFNL